VKLSWGRCVIADDELQRPLDQPRDKFGDAVTIVGRPAYTLAGLTAAAEATHRAIANHALVVYRAATFDGRFVGFADFPVRDGEQYLVTDTKPACSAMGPALLQRAALVDNFEVGRMTRETIGAGARSRDRHAVLGRPGRPSVRAIADTAPCPGAHQRAVLNPAPAPRCIEAGCPTRPPMPHGP
jgi:predicted RecB family nuclease